MYPDVVDSNLSPTSIALGSLVEETVGTVALDQIVRLLTVVNNHDTGAMVLPARSCAPLSVAV